MEEESSAISPAQLLCVVAQVAQAIDTEIPGPGRVPVNRVAWERNSSDQIRIPFSLHNSGCAKERHFEVTELKR